MGWLRPPSDDDPAVILRWVRRVYLVLVPLGLLLSLLLWIEDMSVPWLGLVVAGLAMAGLSTIGPAIRRAEARGPNDPATRPARQRRAKRLTVLLWAGFTAAAVLISLVTDGPGLAVTMMLLLALGLFLGLWLLRRWGQES